MKQSLLFWNFLFLLSIHSTAQENQSLNDGVSGDWYKEAVANLQQIEHDFYPGTGNGNFRTTNSRSRVSFTINPLSYSVRGTAPDGKSPAWNVDFRIKSICKNTTVLSGDEYTVEKKPNHIVYKFRGADIEYTSSREGIRQNFIIHEKPSGASGLMVTMAINTDLSASINDNTLSFYEAANSGTPGLMYSDLAVWDATNKVLPAHMNYDGNKNELNLIVDDREATYPVTIDPLNHSPEWSNSLDGLLSGLLSNTQLNTSLYGFTVTGLGDVNGDGYGDAAISAPALVDIFAGSGNLTAVGAVFVYYGSATGLPVNPSKTLQPTTAVEGALFGFSVAAGDLTGDGINDIIVGAPLDKYSVTVPAIIGSSTITVTAGKVYVYQGSSSPVANPSPFLQIKLGNSFFSQGVLGLLSNINVTPLFGFSVAATDDLNGDNKQDLIVGTPSYQGTSLLSVQTGSAFVYYSNNLATNTPSSLQVPSASVLGLAQLPVVNSSALLFGYSVDGTGDYNGDGYADVVVGAPAGVDLSSLGGVLTGQILGGSAYVYYGTGSGINSSIGAKIHGAAGGLLSNAANLFGYSVKGARSANGLHNGNILVGAPLGGLLPNALSLTVKTGNVQLFKKQSGSPAGVVTADQVLESPQSTSVLQVLNTLQLNVLFGAALDNAYDINCDSYGDLVVGEPLSSGTNLSQLQVNAAGGSAYVYYGMADGTYNPNPVYTVSATYGSDILSVNTAALFGFSVAGVTKIQGAASKPRILVGSPSGALDFNNSVLNLGATIGLLFDFAAGDNGLGKAYTFNPNLCGSLHTLPAKLSTFTGQGIEKKVLLNWKTTAEENLSNYVIEKSTDGTHFNTIGYMFAKNGSGVNEYDMIDYKPVTGMNYYRLRLVNNDNSFTWSAVIKIKFTVSTFSEISIVPNPVSTNYKVKLTGLEKGTYSLQIRNAQGQFVLVRFVEIAEDEYTVNMTKTGAMSPGIYFMHVMNNHNSQVKIAKFIVK